MSLSPDLVRNPAPPLVLRLVRGAHRGAERACRDRDVVLIGSADDCDIVLMGDSGVAPHHCMVRITGGMISVRAVDANIRIDGVDIPPGDPKVVQAFQRIDLGQAAFAMGPHWSKEWQALEQVNALLDAAMERARPSESAVKEQSQLDDHDAIANASESTTEAAAQAPALAKSKPQNQKAVWFLALGLVAALGALVAAFWPVRSIETMSNSERISLVQRQVDRIKGGELKVALVGKLIEVNGVVPTDSELEQINRAMERYAGTVALDVVSGEHISEQVAELLKVGGVNAKTEYIGAMSVRVSGNFGDGVALAKAMNQSAMQDIVPGLKLVPINLDGNVVASTPAKPVAQVGQWTDVLKGAKSFCNTGECFLQFSGTGNTYYVGSELPNGAKLTKVLPDSVSIAIEGQEYEVKLRDLSVTPVSKVQPNAIDGIEVPPTEVPVSSEVVPAVPSNTVTPTVVPPSAAP